MSNKNNSGATLIAHAGTRKITRDELVKIPAPEGTRTHKPVAHFEIIETLQEALHFRHLEIVRDEYAVSLDGMKMFGIMDLNAEFLDCRFSIGLRNSNDKSMRLAMTAGYRVTVCDNMMFSGDFNPLSHKHTRNFELIDSISVAVDRIQRSFLPLEKQVRAMKDLLVNDAVAKLVIYQAFLEKKVKGIPKHLMTKVHKHYFKPEYEDFEGRNLWSLSNAFTSAFKELNPLKQFQTTARLGTFMSDVQAELNHVTQFDLGLERNLNEASVSDNRNGIRGLPSLADFDDEENFDIDDAPELPEDEFDRYFDSEESDEHLAEVIERLEHEDARELKKAA